MSSSNGASATGLHLLSKAEILAARDLARETVEVPEWGGAVLVQEMDVNRRLAYSDYVWVWAADGERKREIRDGVSFNTALVVLGVIDEAGESLFTLAEVEQLNAKHPAPLDRIADVVLRLSRIGKYAEAAADTPLVQTGDSPIDSQDTSDAPSPSLATA